jgi:hypothetical protein
VIHQQTLLCSEGRVSAYHDELCTPQSEGILKLNATSAEAPASAKEHMLARKKHKFEETMHYLCFFLEAITNTGMVVVLADINTFEGVLVLEEVAGAK